MAFFSTLSWATRKFCTWAPGITQESSCEKHQTILYGSGQIQETTSEIPQQHRTKSEPTCQYRPLKLAHVNTICASIQAFNSGIITPFRRTAVHRELEIIHKLVYGASSPSLTGPTKHNLQCRQNEHTELPQKEKHICISATNTTP
jgi:hypothetical protein